MEEFKCLYQNSISLLKKMIAVPSISRDEVVVADLLEAYIHEQNPDVRRKGNNLWVFSPDWDDSKQTILLNSHIDTVRPVSGWQTDPYVPVETADRLIGLGSNDAGASVVCLLHAFLYLTRKKQAYNLLFLVSCEEEVSGKNGIESVLPELPRVDFAIVGEPTGMQPAVAEKGLIVLDCVAKGVAGHAAREEGVNAIYKAMDSIRWFQEYRFPLKTDLLGPVKMSVTVVQAGTQHNVIPDTCSFTVDVRTNECYDNPTLYNLIKENCGCEATARSLRLNSSFIPDTHPIIRRVAALGKKTYGSPTLSDQALMPFPSFKMGPGESARSHTAGEYILFSEIKEAIEFYIKLLDQFS